MIRGTVGRGGSGKSLTTVARLWQLHKRHDRPIYSNTPLIDLRVRRDPAAVFGPHAVVRGGTAWAPVDRATFGRSWAAGYVTRFEQIYDLDNCEVLLDELAAWMPAHKHGKMPDEVRRFLSQDRREGVNVWWTPLYGRTNVLCNRACLLSIRYNGLSQVAAQPGFLSFSHQTRSFDCSC